MKTIRSIQTVIFLGVLALSCGTSKDELAKSFSCKGDCNNFVVEVDGENGEYNVEQTCDVRLEAGDIVYKNCNGRRTYANSGNIYPFAYVIDFKKCKYYVSVEGVGTCGNEELADEINPFKAFLKTVSQTTATFQYALNFNTVGNITKHGICWNKTGNPTIKDQTTNEGTGIGVYNSTIKGLTPNSSYYAKAYAISDNGTQYSGTIDFFTPGDTGEVKDIDGNTYKTINIGTQIWMAENLKTTHYRNGDTISNDHEHWDSLIIGAYCDYEDLPNNSNVFGKLYNWYAVNDSRGLAPQGWHIASDEEWLTLINYLGWETAAERLKEAGTQHWTEPNTSTNETGFTALPGGQVSDDGYYWELGFFGNWWSSTEFKNDDAWYWFMVFDTKTVYKNNHNKKFGKSVRCIKD